MKVITHTVFVHESKRVDKQGRDLHSPSNVCSLDTSKDGTKFRRSDKEIIASNGDFYNVYTGEAVQMEASDLDDVQPLIDRVARDFPDAELPPDAIFADIVTNGGLMLAYGDKIKGRIRHGRSSFSQADVGKAMDAFMDGKLEGLDRAWFKAQPDKGQASKEILAAWIKAGKPS